jgi:hypothetical protein
MSETAAYNVIGRRIVDIRPLTDRELEVMGWAASPGRGRPVALVLDDGGLIFAAADTEYNEFGALNTRTPDGADYTLHAADQPQSDATEH